VLADQAFVVWKDGSSTRAAMERPVTTNKTPLNKVMGRPSNETSQQAVMAGTGLGY